RYGLIRNADIGASLTHRGQSGADRQFTGDKVGATSRAAGFGIVVGEHHALGRQLIEVWGLSRHHSAVVSADVEPADIVAHDDEDVGSSLLLLLRRGWQAYYRYSGQQCQQAGPESSSSCHRECPSILTTGRTRQTLA